MLTTIAHFVGTHEFVVGLKVFFIVAESIFKAKMKKKKEMKEGGKTEGDNYVSPFFFCPSTFIMGGGYNSLSILITINLFFI